MSAKKRYKTIPVNMTESQFDQFVFPHLPIAKTGPKPKVARYKVFNYILYLMHTGCQWYNLPIDKKADGKPEIHYTRVFKIFKRWSDSECMKKLFDSTVKKLHRDKKLDLTVLHGDGSCTAAKKGAII